jgi:isoleucyl-tRNA synthetase
MMKQLAAAIAQMSQEDIAAFETAGTFELCNYALVAEDVEIITEDMPGWLVANNGTITVALDVQLTDQLLYEGFIREMGNRIQNFRKTRRFSITTRIYVEIETISDTFVIEAIQTYKKDLATQILAEEIVVKKNIKRTSYTCQYCINEHTFTAYIISYETALKKKLCIHRNQLQENS